MSSAWRQPFDPLPIADWRGAGRTKCMGLVPVEQADVPWERPEVPPVLICPLPTSSREEHFNANCPCPWAEIPGPALQFYQIGFLESNNEFTCGWLTYAHESRFVAVSVFLCADTFPESVAFFPRADECGGLVAEWITAAVPGRIMSELGKISQFEAHGPSAPCIEFEPRSIGEGPPRVLLFRSRRMGPRWRWKDAESASGPLVDWK